MKLKKTIKRKFPSVIILRNIWDMFYFRYIKCQLSKNFGYKDPSAKILLPAHIANTHNVFMYYHTRIQAQCKIINHTGKFIMKKFSGAAPGLTVITGNHVPIIGIPYYSIPILRTKDIERDVIIEEDVWIGANVTIMSGVTIGRGSIIGACSVVTRSIPPYAVAVGNPAKIIGVKFSLDNITIHETKIYPPEERLSLKLLNSIFQEYYKDKDPISNVYI